MPPPTVVRAACLGGGPRSDGGGPRRLSWPRLRGAARVRVGATCVAPSGGRRPFAARLLGCDGAIRARGPWMAACGCRAPCVLQGKAPPRQGASASASRGSLARPLALLGADVWVTVYRFSWACACTTLTLPLSKARQERVLNGTITAPDALAILSLRLALVWRGCASLRALHMRPPPPVPRASAPWHTHVPCCSTFPGPTENVRRFASDACGMGARVPRLSACPVCVWLPPFATPWFPALDLCPTLGPGGTVSPKAAVAPRHLLVLSSSPGERCRKRRIAELSRASPMSTLRRAAAAVVRTARQTSPATNSGAAPSAPARLRWSWGVPPATAAPGASRAFAGGGVGDAIGPEEAARHPQRPEVARGYGAASAEDYEKEVRVRERAQPSQAVRVAVERAHPALTHPPPCAFARRAQVSAAERVADPASSSTGGEPPERQREGGEPAAGSDTRRAGGKLSEQQTDELLMDATMVSAGMHMHARREALSSCPAAARRNECGRCGRALLCASGGQRAAAQQAGPGARLGQGGAAWPGALVAVRRSRWSVCGAARLATPPKGPHPDSVCVRCACPVVLCRTLRPCARSRTSEAAAAPRPSPPRATSAGARCPRSPPASLPSALGRSRPAAASLLEVHKG